MLLASLPCLHRLFYEVVYAALLGCRLAPGLLSFVAACGRWRFSTCSVSIFTVEDGVVPHLLLLLNIVPARF